MLSSVGQGALSHNSCVYRLNNSKNMVDEFGCNSEALNKVNVADSKTLLTIFTIEATIISGTILRLKSMEAGLRLFSLFVACGIRCI